MKNKNILLIVLAVIAVIVLVSILAFFVPYYYYRYSEPVVEGHITEEESRIIAENHIRESYPYNELNADNLVNIGKSVQDCDSCYSFKYRMEVDSQRVPGEREFAEIEVHVEKGRVNETDFSEGLIINNIVCPEELRNAEVCIDVYLPVCGHDSQGNKIKTYSNSCYACSEPEVEFYRKGEC